MRCIRLEEGCAHVTVKVEWLMESAWLWLWWWFIVRLPTSRKFVHGLRQCDVADEVVVEWLLGSMWLWS